MAIPTPGLDDPALDPGAPEAPGMIFRKFCQFGVTFGREAKALVFNVVDTSGLAVFSSWTSDETVTSWVAEPTLNSASIVATPTWSITGPCTSFSKPALVKVTV